MAHRILLPAFGPIPIRKMFPQMMDIVSQMILRWERLGEENIIACSDDFTRMVRLLFVDVHPMDSPVFPLAPYIAWNEC